MNGVHSLRKAVINDEDSVSTQRFLGIGEKSVVGRRDDNHIISQK